MSFKEKYKDTWAKAANDTLRVISDIEGWIDDSHLLLESGKGAITDQIVEDQDHESGAPDIFLIYYGQVIGAIEVTGSNRVSFPCDVWIGKHKIDYFKNAGLPIAYVIVYKNERRFVTGHIVITYAPLPEKIYPRGSPEWYHVLKPHHTQNYVYLHAYIQGLIQMAEHEHNLMMEIADRHPWGNELW